MFFGSRVTGEFRRRRAMSSADENDEFSPGGSGDEDRQEARCFANTFK
jgi:hypothetical protein